MVKNQPLKLNPDGTPFEQFMLWQGKTVKRCQARKKNGDFKGYQCEKAAVTGTDYCTSHGSGTKKRVKNGSRQPVTTGRPLITGEYSQQFRVVNLLEALEIPLDPRGKDVSLELTMLRLTLAKVLQFEPDLPKLKDQLEKLLAKGDLEYDQAMDAIKSIFRIEGYMQRIQEMALNVVKAAKAMADIENSNAQMKALEEFSKYTTVLKIALRETLEYDQHQAVWSRIEDELKKIRVILPKESQKN